MQNQGRAVGKDGKHYILNGQKIFITNAAWAKTFITYAKVDGETSSPPLSWNGAYPGVSVGPEEGKLGIKGSSTCSVILEDAQVPVENVLHEIGKGHHVAFNILNVGRYKLGAATMGGCKLVLKKAVEYTRVREQFGHPISEFGAIKEKLANCAVKTYMLESVIHRSAGLIDHMLEAIPENDPDYGQKAAQASMNTPLNAPSTRFSVPKPWLTSWTKASRCWEVTGSSTNTRPKGPTGTPASAGFTKAPMKSAG